MLEITLRGADVEVVQADELVVIRAVGKYGAIINLALDQENASTLVDDILSLKVKA